MQIYNNILRESEHASQEGVLKRLAMAIALEHAVPILQEDPQSSSTGESYVDPIQRYLQYEMAYLGGELDPSFHLLTIWELRMVVDGNEPDEIAAWGRSMLRNYRPDHVIRKCYTQMVNSNIRYGSHHVKYDQPQLQRYQNILMNGGVCGRRAFFGRFLNRAFGIPTTARPSKGHGALAHWTPDNGWVVKLGGSWGCGWTKTKYYNDKDFLATTQARMNREEYWKVKRAQWIGDVMGERPFYGEHDNRRNEQLGFWYGLSLEMQRNIIAALSEKDNSMQAAREDGNKYKQPNIMEQLVATRTPPHADKIIYDGNNNEKGCITIHAAAYQNPKHTKDVQVMRCFNGGLQIYLPAFQSQGLTIMRGGTWKNDANGCCSGVRIMSGGYGKYEGKSGMGILSMLPCRIADQFICSLWHK